MQVYRVRESVFADADTGRLHNDLLIASELSGKVPQLEPEPSKKPQTLILLRNQRAAPFHTHHH